MVTDRSINDNSNRNFLHSKPRGQYTALNNKHQLCCKLLSRIHTVQECDARDDDSSTTAGTILLR